MLVVPADFYNDHHDLLLIRLGKNVNSRILKFNTSVSYTTEIFNLSIFLFFQNFVTNSSHIHKEFAQLNYKKILYEVLYWLSFDVPHFIKGFEKIIFASVEFFCECHIHLYLCICKLKTKLNIHVNTVVQK